MEKIRMTTPLVEMDGDEMTRILWKMIKDELLLPFIDLKTEYYDLGWNTVTRPTTRSPSTPLRRRKSTASRSSALPLQPMRPASRSTI